jgi:rhodanese-related sulfurtransferase
MPHDQVDELASRLAPDKSAQVVVYCANGPCDNSEKAAKRLAELGYKNVFDYKEGKEDWIGLGFPVVKGKAPREAEVSACCAS